VHVHVLLQVGRGQEKFTANLKKIFFVIYLEVTSKDQGAENTCKIGKSERMIGKKVINKAADKTISIF
jgi:hypothetical protein